MLTCPRKPRTAAQPKSGSRPSRLRGVHTQRGPVPRGRAPPPPRKHPPGAPYVVFHGKCDIGERLPTPQPFEADEIHAEAELGRGSYFRSE